MFRFASRVIFRSSSYRSMARRNRLQGAPEANKVKILNSDNDDHIRISFRYGNVPNSMNVLTVRAAKDERIDSVLKKIRLVVNLQKKKEELRRVAYSRISGSSELAEVIEDYEEDVKVDLLHNENPVNGDMDNVSVWTKGSVLKIGDAMYDVNMNTPSVVELSLPEYILPNAFIRPHFVLECAAPQDSEFTWYRSVGDFAAEDSNWVKVCDGFTYRTKPEDVGHKLKVVCKPRCGEESGPAVSAVSKNCIEAGPKLFPFEERHKFTKDLVGKDRIRCVSYNILANMYVETKRFPYSSRKARDNYYRKQLITKELLGYNSDLLCLQEVQERTYDWDLAPVLKDAGFQGFFIRKGGRRYEGLALFFRSSKFRAVQQQGIYLNEVVKREKAIFNDLLTKVSGNYKDMSKLLAQDTALQIALLEHVECPEHKLLVANTHLYSNKDTPEVRLLQAALCIYYLEHMLRAQKEKNSMGLIFCGDFNSLPKSAAFNFIADGHFECCTSWKNNSSQDSDTVLRHGLQLGSACGLPEYTNFTEEFMGCLDYIFYGRKNLEVTDVVPMPNHDQVTAQVALPSEFFPSDHIALVCTLRWRHWKQGHS